MPRAPYLNLPQIPLLPLYHHCMHCLLIAARNALYTIIVSDRVIICNARAVENYIPVVLCNGRVFIKWP
jgi:hypothetical protein